MYIFNIYLYSKYLDNKLSQLFGFKIEIPGLIPDQIFPENIKILFANLSTIARYALHSGEILPRHSCHFTSISHRWYLPIKQNAFLHRGEGTTAQYKQQMQSIMPLLLLPTAKNYCENLRANLLPTVLYIGWNNLLGFTALNQQGIKYLNVWKTQGFLR